MARDHLPPLDGLRAIAVILVLLFHAKLVYCGWIGVQVFFVLSGFLITGRLLETSGAGFGPYLRNFYARRALRIFPLYFGYLALLGLASLRFELPGDVPGALPWLATYTFNLTRLAEGWHGSPFYTHFWSLCVEEHFYLVWPLLIFALGPRGRALLVAVCLVGAPLVRLALAAWVQNLSPDANARAQFLYWFSPGHFDAFACGAALRILDLPSRVRRPLLVAGPLAALTLAAGLANLAALRADGVALPASTLGLPLAGMGNAQHLWSYTLINLCSAAAILALLRGGGPGTRLLSHPVPVVIGRVSYGMYVFHWPVLWLIRRGVVALGMDADRLVSWWFAPVFIAAVFCISYASYQLFERRFLELKHRFGS